jgi:hypothetical protein
MGILGSGTYYYNDTVIMYEVLVIAPSAVVCSLVVSRQNQNDRFRIRCRDSIPTVLWMLVPFFDSLDSDLMNVVGLVPLFVVVVLSFRTIIKHFYYNNPFSKLEDKYFEKLKEQADEEQEKLEAQQAKLSYLEELSQSYPRQTMNPSAWKIVAWAVFGILNFLFLFFVVIPAAYGSGTTTIKRSARYSHG